MPGPLRALLAVVPSILCAVAAFFLSFAISGQLWFNLAAGALACAVCLWSLTRRVGAALALAAVLVAAALAPGILDHLGAIPPPESAEVIQDLDRAALPLKTVDAGNGFADLEPLESIWREARVVALGEATHGTSEFLRMKQRIAEFLVTRMAFRHFAMEMEDRQAKLIDTYIQGEASFNPVANLSWPWHTPEMTGMVDWLRAHNHKSDGASRVHFHGIDYQGDRRDLHMAQNTLGLVEALGPDARVVLWAHNAHVSTGAGQMGSYLKRTLHNQVYLTGFEFHHGLFTSNLNWVRTYTAPAADNRYYASALARTGKPILFLDFRTLALDPVLDRWLQHPSYTHDLAEGYGLLRLAPAWVRTSDSWPSLFDGLIYIEESTASGAGR